MAEHRVERRLAAILAADVAGYSRLMGLDEEGTLARLKAHRRDFIDPKIAEHRGRIVKTTGDGMLVEFASVVDAVRCALDVQSGMIPRNADVAGAKRIEFRIGINVGDIITEDQDVFGDEVNIARVWRDLPTLGAFACRRGSKKTCMEMTRHSTTSGSSNSRISRSRYGRIGFGLGAPR
jgi:adenylate cyclase